MGPSSILLFGHQSYILGVSYVGCMDTSVVVQSTTMGGLIGGAGPQPGWLSGPDSCRVCQTLLYKAVSSAGSCTVQGVLGLVPVPW